MGCNCGGGGGVQKAKVRGTGDPRVDREYDNETAARLALARSGKTGTVELVAR
jgi:hypothetical protein